jgi:hypothetical protein
MALRSRRRNRLMDEKTWAGFSKTWPENAMRFLDWAPKKQGLFFGRRQTFSAQIFGSERAKTAAG